MLVVWEPILPTDWEPPATAALARIHQAGVAQFWDHDHLVAREISRELASDSAGPQPRCCTLWENLWDFAALYPENALWRGAPPKLLFADGPVVRVQSSLDSEIVSLLHPKS